MTLARTITALLNEEVSDARKALLLKQYKVTEEQFEQVVRCDPTKTGSYLPWILKLFVAHTIRLPEDEEKVRQRLGEFDALKKKRGFEGHRDINQYKTYGELAQAVQVNSGVKTKNEIKKELAINGAELIGEKGNVKLYKVTTNEAGIALGWRDTEWCVRDPEWFDEYGPPFFCIVDHGDPTKLLHLGDGKGIKPQIMNQYDEEVDASEFEELGMDLSPIIKRHTWWSVEHAMRTGRWPALEQYLVSKPNVELTGSKLHRAPTTKAEAAASYAAGIIGPWPEAEDLIMTSWVAAEEYAKSALRKRWPKYERLLLLGGDAKTLAKYAIDVIKGKWPEAEPEILKDPQATAEYAVYALGGLWPEGEPEIMKSPRWASFYARYGMKARWPEAEGTIQNDYCAWKSYESWAWSIDPANGIKFLKSD